MLQELKKLVPAVPWRIKRIISDAHRDYVFRRAMRQFLKDPEGSILPGNSVLPDLVYGWGNESWSAQCEFLASCIEHALASTGPILECGSGLSTILVGAIANRQRREYWVLEHLPDWAAKTEHCLDSFDIDNVNLRSAPIVDYGHFCWYDAPLGLMPGSFTLVICDGPPGQTRGGRFGLVPVMRRRFHKGCVILLDDADRDEERAIATSWHSELVICSEFMGLAKPYFKIEVLGIRPRRFEPDVSMIEQSERIFTQDPDSRRRRMSPTL